MPPPQLRKPTPAQIAVTPVAGTPVEEPSPRDRHLAKAKPPALEQATAKAPDLGATDPSLKRYQEHRSTGGGALKGALIMLGAIVAACVVFILLVKFVPAVRAQMPEPIQQLFLDQPAKS